MKFTKEMRNELDLLIGFLVRSNKTLSIGIVPGVKTPLDIVTNTSTNTLDTLYKTITKVIESEESEGIFGITPTKQAKINLLNKWKRLIQLSGLYQLDLEEKSNKRKDKLELKKKIEAAKEDAMTPKEKLKDLKKQLAALEEDEED